MTATKVPFQLVKGTATVSLSDAATIATDASLGSTFDVTLGGNRTLGLPTNPTDGQKCIWRVKQDGVGSKTLAFHASFRFSTDIPSITLSTAAGTTDIIGAIYNSQSSTWDIVAFSAGFA